MLCLYFISATTAQIDLWPLLGFLGLVAGIVLNTISVRQSIKKAKIEHDDKYVSKELLNEKTIGMNVQILSISKEVDELKKDNQREHDALKKEFVERLNYIFEWIKEKSK